MTAWSLILSFPTALKVHLPTPLAFSQQLSILLLHQHANILTMTSCALESSYLLTVKILLLLQMFGQIYIFPLMMGQKVRVLLKCKFHSNQQYFLKILKVRKLEGLIFLCRLKQMRACKWALWTKYHSDLCRDQYPLHHTCFYKAILLENTAYIFLAMQTIFSYIRMKPGHRREI